MRMSRLLRHTAFTLAILLLSACSVIGTNNTGDTDNTDGPGKRINAGAVEDAVARKEPFSRYGNRASYEVNGVSYTVMKTNKGYVERGNASWYGKKFHGRKTSSWEVFDIYKATAAHRSLPLPTYAQVTNLDNGKTVLVKINDRGPFHRERIIDLSYAAAVKLGFANEGIAYVEVRAIDIDEPLAYPAQFVDVTPQTSTLHTYIQVGAFAHLSNAQQVRTRLQNAGITGIVIDQASSADTGALHRVRIGPYDSLAKADVAVGKLQEAGITDFTLLNHQRKHNLEIKF